MRETGGITCQYKVYHANRNGVKIFEQCCALLNSNNPHLSLYLLKGDWGVDFRKLQKMLCLYSKGSESRWDKFPDMDLCCIVAWKTDDSQLSGEQWSHPTDKGWTRAAGPSASLPVSEIKYRGNLMIEKCIDWIRESTRRADEYYKAMTMWATSRRNHGTLRYLIELANAYRWALDRALLCLRGLKRSETVEKEIAKTKDYKALITADLELLNDMDE
jgi:hypothetical protein